MIINCKIIQIDEETNVTYNNGTVHRHRSVCITPVELRDDRIEEFAASGHQVNDIVPVRLKPDYYRVRRGGEETEECRSICYMDFWLGGQGN